MDIHSKYEQWTVLLIFLVLHVIPVRGTQIYQIYRYPILNKVDNTYMKLVATMTYQKSFRHICNSYLIVTIGQMDLF